MSHDERIAVVGYGGVFPGAADLDGFWQNLLARRDAARRPPPRRWLLPVEEVFAAEPAADKVTTKRACFVDDAALDLSHLGIEPRLLERLDPMFRLLLTAGHQAWRGVTTEHVSRQRVGVVLGSIALPTDAASRLADEILGPAFEAALFPGRSGKPRIETHPLNRHVTGLPAALLARSLGLRGAAMTLDAACASSLFALKLACDELRSGRAEVMLAGGLSRPDSLYTQMGFSQLRALSPSGRCAPMDERADGLVVGEGAGVVVLKRLSDALADGDSIHAVIAGIGWSNDLGGNLMMPDSEGQLRAMRAAYRQAAWRPDEVDLIECHGTGTPIGDRVELHSLDQLWRESDATDRACVIGSVKGNIGHLLTAAGAAGLVKVLLALRHETLPPMANFTHPAADSPLQDGWFRVLKEPAPWMRRAKHVARRAAISAFGFGGTNAHVLLEEWVAEKPSSSGPSSSDAAPTDRPVSIEVTRQAAPADRPQVAIVGMGSRFGPWQGLRAFAHQVFDSEGDAPWPPNHWWAMDRKPPFRGYFVDAVEVGLQQFRIPPSEIREMLPQQLLMLLVAAETLQDAGISPDGEPLRSTGVFVGIELDMNTTGFHFRWSMVNRARRWAKALGAELDDEALDRWVAQLREAAGPPLTAGRTMGGLASIVASRLARAFRMGGPSFTVSAGETSGLRALEVAIRALEQGEIDTALVGAVDLAGEPRSALAKRLLGEEDVPSGQADREAIFRDPRSDGDLLGEGAAAVLLKRYEDARRDGNHIYAVVRGTAAFSAGVVHWENDAARHDLSFQQALREAGVAPQSLGYVEEVVPIHHDLTARRTNFPKASPGDEPRGNSPATARVDRHIGHAGAASGMAALIRAALSLDELRLPVRRRPAPTSPGDDTARETPSQFWLHNRADGPRRVGVRAMSACGGEASVVLEARETPHTPRHLIRSRKVTSEAIFAVDGDTGDELQAGLARLAAFAGQPSEITMAGLSSAWRRARPPANQHRLATALICDSSDALRDAIGRAQDAIRRRRRIETQGVFYSPRPLGPRGQVAFVFPGSGNQYLGMARQLCQAWPDVARRQDRENDRLADQFAGGRFWTAKSLAEIDARDVILGQVCFGALACDVLASFGIHPQAILGYSLGESAGLFATRTWADRDAMLRRMMDSRLFTEELAGNCLAARRTWKLKPEQAVDWRAGVLSTPARRVRDALRGRQRVYLLIENTPHECVIGGNRGEVERLAADLASPLIPLDGVTTVHCEIARAVSADYRRLHEFNADPPEGVRFYSAAWGSAYEVTRESAADSILAQAVEPFGFTHVVRAAYEDGVRLFVELGPGASCCRMIGQILDGQPHMARSVSVAGKSEVSTMLATVGQLIAERVPVDLEPLGMDLDTDVNPQTGQARITLKIGAERFNVPRPPHDRTPHDRTQHDGSPYVSSATCVDAEPPRSDRSVEWETTHSTAGQAALPGPGVAVLSSADECRRAAGELITPLIDQALATETAKAAAHEAFLRLSRQLGESVGRVAAFQQSLAETVSRRPNALPGRSPAIPAASNDTPRAVSMVEMATENDGAIFLDREACLEFAVGSIARVLGPQFAPVDGFPTRVRLPDEPLMLVDRVVEIEGRPRSMAPGRVVTEHDVRRGAWYLDADRLVTSVTVEAGQADLLLSAYLGADFETRGLAVYRLLDAAVAFHRSLPRPGEVIRYDIRILKFFRQGETRLFRFEFDATVDGQPLMTMRDGCAGFFTPSHLEAGQGIVQTALETSPQPSQRPDDWRELAPMQATSLDDRQIEALRDGRLGDAFGQAFAKLEVDAPRTLPGGRLALIHRVLRIEPEGGRYDLGQIVAEADVRPDDWYLTCHFIDDQVMPGTLMYECALHTLRIFLLRLGWIGSSHDDVVFEPIPGMTSRLKCRGQVTCRTHRVQYEVSIKQLGYRGAEGTPYALADALMYADGKPIVKMSDMSLQASSLTRQGVEALWRRAPKEPLRGNVAGEFPPAAEPPLAASGKDRASRKPAIFDHDSIREFTTGKPSKAFGDRYRPFDKDRVIARLPAAPFQLIDRITSITDCEAWRLAAGGTIESEYDVPPDAWYFTDSRQALMPFSVLLEVALQPCGWMAAFLGSALASEDDLAFRNLGGSGTQLAQVMPRSGTLRATVHMSSVARSGGMIIQNFRVAVAAAAGEVYRAETYFGFFTRDALKNQVGIRDAEIHQPSPEEIARGVSVAYPDRPPLPTGMLRMVDSIDVFIPDGGPHGLGFLVGRSQVDPGAWFFKAHFYQDPVWPGSLGLETLVELLKVFVDWRWPAGGDDAAGRRFEMVTGETHHWQYRGQVIPDDQTVIVQAIITGVDPSQRTVHADGWLTVDGRTIYSMRGFALRVVDGT